MRETEDAEAAARHLDRPPDRPPDRSPDRPLGGQPDQPLSQPPAALPPFESLVAAHGPTVLRVCRALVGATDADDVWQETFLAALRVYPTTAHVTNRQAWLVRIARNKSVDQHRRSARVPEPTENFGNGALTGDAPGGGDAVGRSLEAQETADKVWVALAQLPQRQREAVVYHHIAGLKYADAAALLGNSEAAARRAAADGMKTLRILLAHEKKDRPQ